MLRILAARGELWLDEIWSFRMVHLLASAAGIFTTLHHDNNHHLNSLYLYVLPETTHWMLYRLPAITAGIGSVALAAMIAWRAGRTAAVAAAAFTAFSFLLVLYGSEARGYGMAVFFALLCVLLAERYFASRTLPRGLLFAASAVAGVLSQLTFLHAYTGLVLWTVGRAFRIGRASEAVGDVLRLHSVPVVALVVLYAIDLRFIAFGGGPLTTIPAVMSSALSIAFGGPAAGAGRTVLAVGAIVAGLISLRIIRRSGSDLWLLFGGAVFLAPLMTALMADTSLLFERYFLVALSFLLLSYSWLVAAVAARSFTAALVVIALYVGANVPRLSPLLAYGRGRYMDALADIAADSRRPVPTMGTDHDFRQGRVVGFHLLHMAGGERIKYEPREAWSGDGPEWILVHVPDPDVTPKQRLMVEGRWPFQLTRTYPASELSGWRLALYHNDVNAPSSRR